MRPEEIEQESMRTIEQELQEAGLLEGIAPDNLAVVKRVIHTSADFDFADSLIFTPGAVEHGLDALRTGKAIICDTQMIVAGISKPATNALGNKLVCYVSEPTVIAEAKERGVTRSTVAMERALKEHPDAIVAVGNAPTALFAMADAVESGAPRPSLVLGVPVGFVNVIESKNRLAGMNLPSIIAQGRKGGSTIAVAIINALLYQLYERK